MKFLSLVICFHSFGLLVASSPSNEDKAGTATNSANPLTFLDSTIDTRAPIIPKPFLPSLNHEAAIHVTDQVHLVNRAKGQKGGDKSTGGKQSKANEMIMNQKLQAGNRDVILGCTLGVYGFLGFLALLAWYFDVLPGFGRLVESILEGQHDQKWRLAAEFGEVIGR
ncbi:hypothetical protein BKA64DRAFT_748091 [Cadophora sp. MPI-SDFR-AT-0126]|nr:hypothetical protein BKA64DRAFT_748091 [Leotiomycetes sp. MPI-SDFR-AT-0126]